MEIKKSSKYLSGITSRSFLSIPRSLHWIAVRLSLLESSKRIQNWIGTLFNYSKAVIDVQAVQYKTNEFVSRLKRTCSVLGKTYTSITVRPQFVKFCCYKGWNCNKKVQNFPLPFDSVTFSELTKRVKQWGAISKRRSGLVELNWCYWPFCYTARCTQLQTLEWLF